MTGEPHPRPSGAAKVADEIRSREQMTGADGFVLTLLDVIEDRDRLAAELRAVKLPEPERPIRGGLISASCPHCGGQL